MIKKAQKNVKKINRYPVYYWPPRILSILFIIFISLLALDVFAEDYSIVEMIIGFIMHMLPSFALIAILILSWKKELIGGIAYLILGTFFTIFFHTYEELIGFLLISAPVFITGFLFILSHKKHKSSN
ncbi:hypothetical protein ACFL21_00935 [Patescibacteria group bacterium]